MKPFACAVVWILVVLGVFSVIDFSLWWFHPDRIGNIVLYGLLTLSLWFYILRCMGYWVLFCAVKPHEHHEAPPGLTVDAFTTAAPGEPVEMTMACLRALKAMTYPHETYLLDDSHNPQLAAFCHEAGIHYRRRGNKTHAKCGNVNHGLYHSYGEFVLIVDPDHIVEPHYLDRVLGQFGDPAVGFVQTTQAYGNQSKSWVAQGGAEQTYFFYGPVMMGMSTLGANPVIGTNCTFRRRALESIGLYQPGLAEDLHTAMALHSRGWKGIYVPEILARGLTPEDLPAFCHQQLKWSRGVMELLRKSVWGFARGWTWPQRFVYALSMAYYFESVMMAINLLIPLLSMSLHQTPVQASFVDFARHLGPWCGVSLVLFFYTQRWLRDPQEKGLMLSGLLLHVLSFPCHLLGILYALLDKKVPYLPTAKTAGESGISLFWIAPSLLLMGLTLLGVGYALHTEHPLENSGMVCFALWNLVCLLGGLLLCTLPKPWPAIALAISRQFRLRVLSYRHSLWPALIQVCFIATRFC